MSVAEWCAYDWAVLCQLAISRKAGTPSYDISAIPVRPGGVEKIGVPVVAHSFGAKRVLG